MLIKTVKNEIKQLSEGVPGAKEIIGAFGKRSVGEESNPNTIESRSKRYVTSSPEEKLKAAANFVIKGSLRDPKQIVNNLNKITQEEIKNANITEKDDLETAVGKIIKSSKAGQKLLKPGSFLDFLH